MRFKGSFMILLAQLSILPQPVALFIDSVAMTRQKFRYVALQQSVDQLVMFMADISMFEPEMIV